jgi:hypothetical protein
MSKSLRLSEKWFRRGLWLVAVVFAGFLIGLGSTLVGDLPQVERERQMDDTSSVTQRRTHSGPLSRLPGWQNSRLPESSSKRSFS